MKLILSRFRLMAEKLSVKKQIVFYACVATAVAAINDFISPAAV